ncbi:8698_t:CDS:2, partial [Acaulospora morrowiae]
IQLMNAAMEAKFANMVKPDPSPGMLSTRSALTKSIENSAIIMSSPSSSPSFPEQSINISTSTHVPDTRDKDSPSTGSEQSKDSDTGVAESLSSNSSDNSLNEYNGGPAVNFGEETAETLNQYSDLGRRKSSYQPHTRKLSTGEVKIMPQELQQDIAQFGIDGFARKYFNTHKRGIFRRKVPVEKMLLHQKESLKRPLMILNPTIQKDATKCFKTIQRIMGDRHRGRGPVNVLEDIQ